MRQISLDKVENVVRSADKPVSVGQIVAQTNLSSQTVTLALSELGAVALLGHSPKTYILTGDTASRTLPTVGVGTGKSVIVDLIEEPNWIGRWDRSRMRFGNNVLALHLNETSNPAEMAKHFAEAASALASLAYALTTVQGDPDWYEKMSGDTPNESE
jgi:hypothetical protein